MAQHQRSRTLRLTAAIATTTTALGLTVISSSFANAASPTGIVYGEGSHDAVQGSYIVLLKENSSQEMSAEATKADLVSGYGGILKRDYRSIKGFSAHDLTPDEARELAADPNVDKVVTNKIARIDATQENPPSWGLDRSDQTETQGDAKYNYPDSAGEGVTAYVIDSGARFTHTDFGGRATSGYDFIDDDADANDEHGHGTHVSGTVSGTAFGIAKKAKVVAVKCIAADGTGSTEGIIAAVDWVTTNHQGPSVANMSLSTEPDEALDAAVKKSIDSGVTYAVAAGNELSEVTRSPARLPEAITVGASMEGDAYAPFSNYGKPVDIFAPGLLINSAWATDDNASQESSGTSMSTPHVVGAAAIYLAGHQGATPADVTKALIDGATNDVLTSVPADTVNKLLKVVE